MKIGILSDSHDNLPVIRRAVELLNREGVGLVVHAGDIVAPFAAKELLKLKVELIAVYGNNDGEKAGLRKVIPQLVEPPLIRVIDGKKLVVTHDLGLTRQRIAAKAAVVVHGHTHQSEVRREGGTLYINPGECGGWLTGRRTVALLDLDALDGRIVELE